MAKFEIAEAITGRNEGGYANNPADKGGETYAGIARKFHPSWEGWKFVDEAKKKVGYDVKTKITKAVQAKINALLRVPAVDKMISVFYKRNFWNINYLDFINDQQIANTIYDFSVNAGEDRAVRFVQEEANRISTDKVKLVPDGDLGTKSLAAINSLDAETLHNAYNERRRKFYISRAVGDQAQFLPSWLGRLKKYVKSK